MSLPPQETKESYTYDEVQHIVAREWAKGEIMSNKAAVLKISQQLLGFMATAQADSKALRDMLANFPASVALQIDNCRKDMRREIEQDFPNKMEAMRMEQRIEEKIGDTDRTLGKQISDTDKTLGKQISELDRKMDTNSAELATQIKEIDNKVQKQWLKISIVVSTIVCVGGFLTWFFTTGKFLTGG